MDVAEEIFTFMSNEEYETVPYRMDIKDLLSYPKVYECPRDADTFLTIIQSREPEFFTVEFNK